MSDLMLLGILRMPMPELPDRAQVVTYTQFVLTARKAAGRIEELEHELAEARRDAERYRWLNENATDIRWEGCHVVRATMHCLDASIGASMKESEK